MADLELATRRLSNKILISGAVTTPALLIAEAGAGGDARPLGRGLLVAAAGLVVFGCVYVLARSQLGGGDVKFAGLLGLGLGWFEWGTATLGI